MEKNKSTLTPEEWKIAADRVRELGQKMMEAASTRKKDTACDSVPAAHYVNEPSN